ncbi:hypothetical protein OA161_00525 [Candidatus Pelagibacter sp.]|nr:hypothetical protein [Candidatus Pelagibacter sp.]
MKKKDYNRNPKGLNQWKLRTDRELQSIIDSKPQNWTKKDFRGEGKLNKEKLMTRKETDRKTLKFYQTGRIYIRNLKDHFNHSTEKSVEEYRKGEIDFETLKNRSSTIKWRNKMSENECKIYDKKVYASIKNNKKKLNAKRRRQKKWYDQQKELE